MSETTAPQTSVQSEEISSSYMTGDLQNVRVTYRLNEKNYLKWSQFVKTYLKGKGRLSHLLGTGPKPGGAGFSAWDEADSMIMSWLWDSMEPAISDTFMFLTTAKDIWESVRRTYSKARDAAQIYEIKEKARGTKQGNKTVTEYANTLQNLWQELDHYRVFVMKCSEDAVILKSFIEKDRVYDFLAGLNSEFDQVRVQILGKDEVPSLEESISLVRAEESRRSVMLEPQMLEGSALMTARTEPKTEAQRTQWNNNRDNLWCTFCKKPRHTKERCWKLHGKPASQEWGNRGAQSNQSHPNRGAQPNRPRSQAHLTEFQTLFSEQKGNQEEQQKESFN